MNERRDAGEIESDFASVFATGAAIFATLFESHAWLGPGIFTRGEVASRALKEGLFALKGTFLVTKNISSLDKETRFRVKEIRFLVRKSFLATKEIFSVVREIFLVIKKTIPVVKEISSMIKEKIPMVKKVSSMVKKVSSMVNEISLSIKETIFELKKFFPLIRSSLSLTKTVLPP